MNDLREQLAETIMANRAVDNWGNPLPSDYDLADTLTKALPDMVQPLVWVRHPIGWNCTGFMIDTRTGFYVMRGLYGKPRFDTLEAAQAACNAHHVATIMQAFGVQKENEDD